MKKILLSIAAVGVTLVGASMFAAFEAHVVNVTARIENALEVPLSHIDFGTVFPQEVLVKDLPVRLSGSFMTEPRVDDVRYFLRQKPKCGVTTDDGQVLVGPTATGHVIPTLDDANTPGVDESKGGTAYTIDCGPAPRTLDQNETWGMLPLLCPYLSKHERSADGLSQENDGSLNAFHVPFTVSNSQVNWLDTPGYLSKLAQDIDDLWAIDLAVPCFGGYCAQDWASHVLSINPLADPAAYTQDIANEHKVFGCDLWLEVSGVSETPIESVN